MGQCSMPYSQIRLLKITLQFDYIFSINMQLTEKYKTLGSKEQLYKDRLHQ